jgi:hypothetical protein
VTNEESFDQLVAAARAFIRNEEGCIVSIGELLEGLSGRLSVPEDTYTVLNLIAELWDDPHIDQVPDTGDVEFAWNNCDSDPSPFCGLVSLLERRPQIPAIKHPREYSAPSADAVQACVNLVRESGDDGVLFPELADLVSSLLNISPFGEETMLLDSDHPNTVCWNYASREFLEVVSMMLEHTCIQMVRTTAQRYYDRGAPLEVSLDPYGGDGPLMPPVEGDIAESGYATHHWVPTMFIWNAEPTPPAGETHFKSLQETLLKHAKSHENKGKDDRATGQTKEVDCYGSSQTWLGTPRLKLNRHLQRNADRQLSPQRTKHE